MTCGDDVGFTDRVLDQQLRQAIGKGLDAAFSVLMPDTYIGLPGFVLDEDAEAAATKQVRLWYVLEEIAKAEKIEAKDEEKGKKVIEFVLANAKK